MTRYECFSGRIYHRNASCELFALWKACMPSKNCNTCSLNFTSSNPEATIGIFCYLLRSTLKRISSCSRWLIVQTYEFRKAIVTLDLKLSLIKLIDKGNKYRRIKEVCNIYNNVYVKWLNDFSVFCTSLKHCTVFEPKLGYNFDSWKLILRPRALITSRPQRLTVDKAMLCWYWSPTWY